MFKIALRYVIREKIRTVVSVLGIAVSVMLMFSLVQMGDCIRHQFSEMVTSGMKRDFTIYGVTYGQIQQAEELLLEKGVKDNYLLTMKAGIWYEEDVNPIARALSNMPKIILADEPTGNLDSETGKKVLKLLLSGVRKYGQTLIMITHNEDIAGEAERIYYMRDGVLHD